MFDRGSKVTSRANRVGHTVSLGLAALLLESAALAQQPPTNQQSAEAETLESIVVTARRREESLQDTPIAVTALTAEALERQQATGTMDLDKIAPNLQFHSYGTLTGNNSAAQVFIRGIGQTDATPAVDPGVGIYIDDVYMGRSVGGAMEFRDIASVQILRGPQGTLFGRNTIGGAVLLTTNAPGDDAGNSIRVGVGRTTCAKCSARSTFRWATNFPRVSRSADANATATSRACSTARISATKRCTPASWASAGSRPMPSRSRCAATTPRKTRTARPSCSSR